MRGSGSKVLRWLRFLGVLRAPADVCVGANLRLWRRFGDAGIGRWIGPQLRQTSLADGALAAGKCLS
jgi:hypothetical protein